jgi:hypothetical protein
MSAVHTSRKFGEFLICSTIVDICKAGKSFNHLGDSTAQNGSMIQTDKGGTRFYKLGVSK